MLSISQKPVLFTALLLLSFTGCAKEKERLAKAGEIAQEVQTTLAPAMMKKLFGIIEKEGYSAAVQVCAGTAKTVLPAKSAEFTEKFKADGIGEIMIRRVSLKVRNPADEPNELEQKILQEWKKQEADPGAEKAKLTTRRSGEHYYALLPIRIVAPQCLKCHGTQNDLDPEAAAKIKEFYPGDEATDYQMNDLRGAFSVRVKFQ